MSKPRNLEEALNRVPKMSDESLANQLAKQGLFVMEEFSTSAVKNFNNLSIKFEGELGNIDVIKASEMSVSNDNAVRNISWMMRNSKGLTKLALVTQLLLHLAGSSEGKNAHSAVQLLAWMKNGKELSIGDKFAKFGSQANQIFPAMERALRTPTENWDEVKDLVSSGGGMKYLAEVFAGTPAEIILDVVARSLINALKLRESAQEVERSKIDVQKATLGRSHTIGVRTKAGQDHLKKFNAIQEKYYKLQAELDMINSFTDAEKMIQLSKLAKECDKALLEVQKWNVLVKTDPALIEEARAGLSHGMRATDAYALNQARLENLSIQFRQFALSSVSHLVITLSAISASYCDRVLAENRKEQMLIVANCRKTLELVARGEFEKAIGDSELSMALSPA